MYAPVGLLVMFAVLLVPLILVALLVLPLVLILKAIRGPERGPGVEATQRAVRENQELHAGLEKMEQRIEALEEILMERFRKPE